MTAPRAHQQPPERGPGPPIYAPHGQPPLAYGPPGTPLPSAPVDWSRPPLVPHPSLPSQLPPGALLAPGTMTGSSPYPYDVGGLACDTPADRREFRISADSRALRRLTVWHWATKVLPVVFAVVVGHASVALFHIDTGNAIGNAVSPYAGAGIVAVAGGRRGRRGAAAGNEAASDVRSMTDQQLAAELRARQDIRGDPLSAWYGSPSP